jgi:CheY-like chemotaxis protein
MVQVLGNLLSNAAKYTNPGGRIELSARPSGEGVEIRVRDDGIGIPAESQPKLFQLFSRLESGSDRTPGGLGIGLALVRRLVEMHGGAVEVSSDGAGRGSEFRVRLPVGTTGALPATPSRDDSPPREGRRILIADDNADALESLALLLERAGHEVWTATNGAEACELAESEQPDVALLDIGMPVLDGYDAARRIRATPWGREMRLIAVSGWGQSADVQRSHASGFDAHLVKPVSFDVLADAIELAGASESQAARADGEAPPRARLGR